MVFEAKAAASATVIGFGSFTTALLQWFVSPYVKTMRIEPGGRVVARKFAWNASEYETTFAASGARDGERAAVGFVGGGWAVLLRRDGDGAEIHVRGVGSEAVRRSGQGGGGGEEHGGRRGVSGRTSGLWIGSFDSVSI